MDSADRESTTDLIQELLDNPSEFDFFQAVRLIEIFLTGLRRHESAEAVGSNAPPSREPIRFRALPSLSFPPGQVAGVRSRVAKPEATDVADRFPIDMIVSFMGLTGPAGVLPAHYTSLLIERAHPKHNDQSMRAFFDLFNHRLISFFYRAWEKYRFPFVYEQNIRRGEFEDDLFTRCLFSLTGLQLPGLRHRFTFDDHMVPAFGGLFADRGRSAAGLQQILETYFEIDADVIPFVGQWLYLSEDLQTAFPSKRHRSGLNLQLGTTAVVGSRAWDVQGRFRIRLGALNMRQFSELLPGGKRLSAVVEVVRYYVGINLDFDIQLVLQRQDVPACRLSSEPDCRPLLGWTTWLSPPSPSASESVADADDAVFRF